MRPTVFRDWGIIESQSCNAVSGKWIILLSIRIIGHRPSRFESREESAGLRATSESPFGEMTIDEKMKSAATNPLHQAVGNTIDALREQEERISKIERDLKSAKARRSDFIAALSALARTLPKEDRKEIQALIKDILPSTGDPVPESDSPMQAIMNMMIARDKDTVKVEEVQNFLDEKGFGVSSRYASNTLHKLAEQGHLIRICRGRYRLNDLNIHAMGLMPEDYEE